MTATGEEIDPAKLIPLALGVARKLAARGGMQHFEDELGSVALSALAAALVGYDAGVGPVEPYAIAWVGGEVRKAIDKERKRREVLYDDAEVPSANNPATQAEDLARDVVDAFLSGAVGAELRTNGEAELLRREAWAVLRAEVERLDAEDRQLVALRYWSEEEPTWREVGAALGLAEVTAKKRDARIRERLRDALVAWDRVRPLRRGWG
jgi:RNA polymerase sigma factor (sigma-70 family)